VVHLVALATCALAWLAPATSTAVAQQGEARGRRSWNFNADRAGAIAAGFRSLVGRWEVADDGGNHVLEQRAESERRAYNLTLIDDTSYGDLDLSVRVKAGTGEVDQGGGIVWRARDQDNYYVARYNPLEDNYRAYKVENGRRTQLDHADAPGDRQWHTLRITMKGREMIGYLDGKKVLVVEDSTFRDAGKIGLWSKADARSSFDDLTVSDLP
jgi:hypothetical protein